MLTLARGDGGRFAVVAVQSGIEVVLGLYSGVPDPTWLLTAAQADELTSALAKLSRTEGRPPAGGLGYRGFAVITPNGRLVAFAGKVARNDTRPPLYLDDPNRTVERLLLETARSHVSREGLAEVERALDEP